MKNIVIAFLLFVLQTYTCWGQKVVNVYNPNFKSYSKSLNDSTLIDRVKYNKNNIYYEFKNNDTISEFFFLNDSIYKYRESIKDKDVQSGQFKFNTTKIDSIIRNPPGQYEQELICHLIGDLEKTGWWNEWSINLSGRYVNDVKVGTWKQRDEGEKIEYSYIDGKLISILNPNIEHIKSNLEWIESIDLKLCLDSTNVVNHQDRFEIVSSACKCFTRDTSPQIYFNLELPDLDSPLKWILLDTGEIELEINDAVEKYSVWRYGKDRINIVKSE